MYLLQGTFSESPQRTHRWNKVSIKDVKYSDLKHDADVMVHVEGDHGAGRRWLGPIPLYHMVLFGGWKKFVVVEPKNHYEEWHAGWLASGEIVVSKIPQKGRIRLGVGSTDAHFFAVDERGYQIPIDMVGEGFVREAGEFVNIPLL